ncbi:MAG: UDP-N-acetylmuramoyl-tripeptide--D-alanyl-D-alanine ligase, partial [Peptococcaceae bacterium]|nr:UDP-N-acetylmuramoyl-tripeptide--D-alanyl-D-alanine ligase [Peptococcaceae bacterium]
MSMIAATILEIAGVTGGRLVQGDPAAVADSVSTDTRTLQAGALFFALTGPKYDAHHYLGEAVSRGAAGLVVEKEVIPPPGVPVILVRST